MDEESGLVDVRTLTMEVQLSLEQEKPWTKTSEVWPDRLQPRSA